MKPEKSEEGVLKLFERSREWHNVISQLHERGETGNGRRAC